MSAPVPLTEPEWVPILRDLSEYAKYLEALLWDDDTEAEPIVNANAILADWTDLRRREFE